MHWAVNSLEKNSAEHGIYYRVLNGALGRPRVVVCIPAGNALDELIERTICRCGQGSGEQKVLR